MDDTNDAPPESELLFQLYQGMRNELNELRKELSHATTANLVTANLVVTLAAKIENLHAVILHAINGPPDAPQPEGRMVGVSLSDWPAKSPS